MRSHLRFGKRCLLQKTSKNSKVVKTEQFFLEAPPVSRVVPKTSEVVLYAHKRFVSKKLKPVEKPLETLHGV